MISTASRKSTAVVVGLLNRFQDDETLSDYFDELEFLLETADIKAVKRFAQKLDKPDTRYFIGSGKLNEINEFVKENDIDLLVFDDELSPSQIRNLQKFTGKKILDRSDIIIDIFAARARTAHARTQVELAYYQHMLPRLTGMWTHLERQRGGTGTRGGAGEKEIETDRRQVRDKITLLRKRLADIDKQMAVQRKSRGELIRVSLVGYTNAGKSTIMNLLSKSDVFAENKLFATLDTTVRKVILANVPFLLSDTVGFIRKLPPQLIESFKSTLDEVREADVLIHVVDISNKNFEDHIAVVNKTLQELNAADKPTILVFNKTDAYTYTPKDADDLSPVTRENFSLADLQKSWMSKLGSPGVFISAANKTNLDELRNILYEKVKEMHVKRYPYNNLLY